MTIPKFLISFFAPKSFIWKDRNATIKKDKHSHYIERPRSLLLLLPAGLEILTPVLVLKHRDCESFGLSPFLEGPSGAFHVLSFGFGAQSICCRTVPRFNFGCAYGLHASELGHASRLGTRQSCNTQECVTKAQSKQLSERQLRSSFIAGLSKQDILERREYISARHAFNLENGVSILVSLRETASEQLRS